jgi:flagellar hook assembly protein FlgD
MYTAGTYFKTAINPGFAQVVGEYIYSSAYDVGEFWGSGNITPTAPLVDSKSNLYVNTSGPNATIRFGMVGDADDARTAEVTVNGTVVGDTVMNGFSDWLTTEQVPVSLLSSNSITVNYINNSTVSTDWMVASFYELNYPRLFNFGGQEDFYFQLPARSAGFLLNITNVPLIAGSTPVLYDETNGLQYTAVVNPDNSLSFALGGSTAGRNLVLVNEDPATVQSVTSLTVKNFVNFSNAAIQGNFVIISNPILYPNGTGGNAVADYMNYRKSSVGGGFDAQMYDINELVDQFGFGIAKDPLSIQNFLRYANSTWSVKPAYVLLIGHGMCYTDYWAYHNGNHDPLADQLDLVPTFGYPASDNMLDVNNGQSTVPNTPIGRLSVCTGAEIETYLTKLEQYEQVQQTAPNTVAGRLWMKNFVHLTGVSEPYLGTIICNYMVAYQQIITDTLIGASVSLFCDGNASTVAQVPPGLISNLFSTGFSVLNYFGHSSNAGLGYNLDNPSDYDNVDKYPVFFVNGCDAGDFFIYDPNRMSGVSLTLSESYELANQRGSIGFVAATNFEIVNYCNIYLNDLYLLMDGQDYGKPLGQLQKDALQGLINSTPGDFFGRSHAEQMAINGDPYMKLDQGPTDYDIESSGVVINPSFISTSNTSFTVSAKFYDLGKAVNDSLGVIVTRIYPNGTSTTLYNKKVAPVFYADSIQLTVPIVPTRDIGDNKIVVTIDPGNVIPEITYANNSITTDVYIYQNGATPVYPYNYAIINTPTSLLVASTNNPILPTAQYEMQLDTTQNFNSSLLVTKTLTQIGGELEFNPGVTYRDSTVYYWRVAAVPAAGTQAVWGNASFIYIDPSRSTTGFNQSHYFQHEASTTNEITLGANRQWAFNTNYHNIYQRNAVYPDGGTYDVDFSVSVDGAQNIQSACLGQSLIFNVFNPVTMDPWKNVDSNGNNLYLSGSAAANCVVTRNYNFEFSYMDAADRYKMVRFMDSIPNGYWVTVKNIPFDVQSENVYAPQWLADTAIYGPGVSLYSSLYNAGFTGVGEFTTPLAFLFIYKKNDPSFTPQWVVGDTLTSAITLSSTAPAPYFSGTVTSPQIGPAKQWNSVHWRGADATNPATDTVGVQVIGIDTLGNATPLYNLSRSVQDFNISAINAKQYPYLQFKESTYDSIHGIPYQLHYWRANYVPVPEGALAPNIVLKAPDTVVVGQPIEFAIAFKNVSPYAFDSMTMKMYITDASNVTHNITLPKKRPIASGDTLILDYTLPSNSFIGNNTIYVDFNPNVQPEQYLFNNFVYKTVYVKGDGRGPTMDVTFDNVHILNDDIVSSKPNIEIKLQSQAQYLLLKDTSLVTVQVTYPNGQVHPYYFSNDTLRFTPATSTSNNVATVNFTPSFTTQINPNGDVYQLAVTGKDEQGNTAGVSPYRVAFTVINKPMISNMLNYPNPFSTSTAFVFTITGSTVPQDIKIEILTITGKVVRQITKEELGPLHIGLNITQYKWNGTDQYGNRLANGVYLYHVMTNLNGKSLSKYSAAGDNTNQYFVNGYGKMYLMR